MSDTTHYGDYQIGIYMQGMMGIKPDLPMEPSALEDAASETLDERAFWYVAGGAGAEDTLANNEDAFGRWDIVPRMLTDVSARDYRCKILNTELHAPLMLAPIGVQEIVHPEAELAVARAAASLGMPMILSTLSSHPLEAVAETLGGTPRWFQLYWPKDDAFTNSLLARAEAAGYEAIVVTLDTRLMGWRINDLEEAYLPFLEGKGIANYTSDPVFRAALDAPPEEDMRGAVARWAEVYSDPAHTWDDLKRLRDNTSLPLVLKGILHPDDARKAVAAGMDGIIVSNHGGRQIGGAIGALDALPGVVEAAEDKLPVLFDSGIRHGSDIVKALALGAKAALLGRPYIWGLAVAGEEGVREVIRRTLADFDLAMALAGLRSTAEATSGILARRQP